MNERESLSADLDESVNVDIEGALMDGLEDDPRLGNGVPSHLRGSDLDFIQMSGLTVAGDGEPGDAPEPDDDLDPNVPVSFYEEGVDDVDSRRTPLGMEAEAGSADEVIVRKPRMSSSIESLREIVADLTAGGTASPPPPAVVAPVDLSEDRAKRVIEEIVVPEDDDGIAELSILKTSGLSRLGPLPEDAESTPIPAAPAPAVAASKESVAERVAAPARKPDLSEAESLLQRLEAQTGVKDEPLVDDFEVPEIPEARVHDREGPETDESVYHRPNAPARRFNKRRRVRRRMVRLLGLAVLLAALGVGGYQAYGFYKQQTATESDAYRAAARLAEGGRHAEAASAFASLMSRYPQSALAGDAALMAARSYEQAGEHAAAVKYYELFRAEYPDHPKYHRATTLLALALVRGGEYEQAITLLQRPEQRTLDAEGYLASLRGLAQAHAALGQIDEARSAYLRAASLEGNYTADADYLALAALYQSQAESAVDAESRKRYLALAVDQWDFAMRTSGITESRRREIKARRDVAIGDLGDAALETMAEEEPEAEIAGEASDTEVKADEIPADNPVEMQDQPETPAPVGIVEEVPGEARSYEEEQTRLMHVD